MRFIVGFDDSEGAWDALALARRLGTATGAKVELVRVLDAEDMLAVPYRVLERESFPDADPLELASEALCGLEVSTRSYAGGSPAHVLHDLAESEAADLVIVGAPHRGALGRTFLGSVAESLLHGSSRPLLVAPRGYAALAHGEARVLAVAYDGTREAKLALRYAEALAATLGARIRILTVAMPAVPLPAPAGYAPPPPLGFEPERLVEEALAAVQAVEAEGERLSGAPAAALAEACAEDVDLLVAGSRGYGPLGRVFAGSVSSSLIRRASCPVLVVPRSRGEAPETGAAQAGRAEVGSS